MTYHVLKTFVYNKNGNTTNTTTSTTNNNAPAQEFLFNIRL